MLTIFYLTVYLRVAARKVTDIFVSLNFIDRIAVIFLNTKYHKNLSTRKRVVSRGRAD